MLISIVMEWRTKATLSLVCLEETTVLCLSLENYQALRAALPKIEHFFLEKVTLGFLAAQQHPFADDYKRKRTI